MKETVCSVCGFVYSEEGGIPETGIAPGTRWEELPEDWVCPLCGAAKGEFLERRNEQVHAAPSPAFPSHVEEELRELTPLQASALCSNLARGCEKQYKAAEAALFTQLADYFKAAAAPAADSATEELLRRVEQDLGEGIPSASTTAAQAKDRGAMRAMVWNEKVTRILKSLLGRYAREGDVMLQNTGVYVCVICGFVYVGSSAPAMCPVCKAPGWKLEKVEGRAS